jgi:hypothetical protein
VTLDRFGLPVTTGSTPALALHAGAVGRIRSANAGAPTLPAEVMTDLPRIAGGHARREVFEDTLIAALRECGRREPARRLLARRFAPAMQAGREAARSDRSRGSELTLSCRRAGRPALDFQQDFYPIGAPLTLFP